MIDHLTIAAIAIAYLVPGVFLAGMSADHAIDKGFSAPRVIVWCMFVTVSWGLLLIAAILEVHVVSRSTKRGVRNGSTIKQPLGPHTARSKSTDQSHKARLEDEQAGQVEQGGPGAQLNPTIKSQT